MQVCTTVLGNTEVMASGNPLSPSTTAIRMSWTPRLRSSLMTRSQNFAPSVCSIHRPQNLLAPRAAQANRQIYRAIADQPFVADLHPQRVEEHHRIGRLQAPILPGRDFLQYRVGYRTYQVRRDLGAVQLADVLGDLARRHPARIQGDDLLVEAGQAPPILADQHRVEAPLAIPRDRQLQLACVGDYRFAAIAIAVIATLRFRGTVQMMVQLGIEHALG